MPYVNIKVTKENGEPTVAQKEELIKGVTELLHTVLGRNRASGDHTIARLPAGQHYSAYRPR